MLSVEKSNHETADVQHPWKKGQCLVKVISLSSADNGVALQTQEIHKPIGLYGM